MSKFIIELVSNDENLVHSWQCTLNQFENISVVHGCLDMAECDALVSLSDGMGSFNLSSDPDILNRIRPTAITTLRALMARNHEGLLGVGFADIVPTGGISRPFLILAPTDHNYIV
jgi:hypothetical protein